MDTELQEKLKEIDAKIEAIWRSVEKTRKYFQVTLWVTIILFFGPLILLTFAIPSFLNSYLGALSGANIQDLQGL